MRSGIWNPLSQSCPSASFTLCFHPFIPQTKVKRRWQSENAHLWNHFFPSKVKKGFCNSTNCPPRIHLPGFQFSSEEASETFSGIRKFKCAQTAYMSYHYDLQDKIHIHKHTHTKGRGKKIHVLGLCWQSTRWGALGLSTFSTPLIERLRLLCFVINIPHRILLSLPLVPLAWVLYTIFSRQIRICTDNHLPKITWVAPSCKNANDSPESRTRWMKNKQPCWTHLHGKKKKKKKSSTWPGMLKAFSLLAIVQNYEKYLIFKNTQWNHNFAAGSKRAQYNAMYLKCNGSVYFQNANSREFDE